jgi:hypothetical protein
MLGRIGSLAVRIGIGLGLTAFWGLSFGQTANVDGSPQPVPAVAAYRVFFGQVLLFKKFPDPGAPVTSGEPVLTHPPNLWDNLRATVGLTDRELVILTDIAADCDAKLAPLDQAVRPLTFESRLAYVESGTIPAALSQRMSDLEKRRDQVVLDHLKQLKTGLSESTFKKLDDYMLSPEGGKRPVGMIAPAAGK